MKKAAKLLVIGFAALAVVGAIKARAEEQIYVGADVPSTDSFYQPLAAEGYWVWMQPHGWCWYPAYVDQGWRPYTAGHWVWSDYGWYWVSDEPWGWATYHYGRWTYDSYYGWIWVPGTEWAPSWVAWREGGGYVGWAPLPPRCVRGYGGYYAFEESWVGPDWYVFVGFNSFCSPHTYRTVRCDRTIVNKTVNITKINIKNSNNVVINTGPGREQIRTANRDRFREVKFTPSTTTIGQASPKLERRLPPQLQSRKDGRTVGVPGRTPPTDRSRLGAPATVPPTRPTETRSREKQTAEQVRQQMDQRRQDWEIRKQEQRDRKMAPVAPAQNFQPAPPPAPPQRAPDRRDYNQPRRDDVQRQLRDRPQQAPPTRTAPAPDRSSVRREMPSLGKTAQDSWNERRNDKQDKRDRD